MEEIFAGRLFHGGMPVAKVRMMLTALGAFQKDPGYDPAHFQKAGFYASGRAFPRLPDRTSGVEPGFGLGESVFDRDGVQLVQGNCFACHAGVVNG